MDVVMVAAECGPVARATSVADVVPGLAGALEVRGHAVEIVLPKYDGVGDGQVDALQPALAPLPVPWFDGRVDCTVWSGAVRGRRCFLVEPNGPERLFAHGPPGGRPDDLLPFAFFCRAALEFLLRTGKRPAVIHTHDWQTALVAPILFEIYQGLGMPHQRVCHTIHDFARQGTAGPEVLWATGLGRPEHFLSPDRLGDDWTPGVVNPTKGAVVFANFVATVSPRHAWEARHTDQGHGLGRVLERYHDRFGGILNGLDYDVWNPETDPALPVPFGPDRFAGKAHARHALRRRLGLREASGPLVAWVGPLDASHGTPLVRDALELSLAGGGQFVLLACGGDPAIEAEFRALAAAVPPSDGHLAFGSDDALAHLVYAGADLVVVPSLSEPCGRAQMIALRYGAVPVVRWVGGLRDTVFDADWSERPPDERNGFAFEHYDRAGLESAIGRAFALWHDDPDAFRRLACAGMRCDHSWAAPAHHYEEVYEFIRHR